MSMRTFSIVAWLAWCVTVAPRAAADDASSIPAPPCTASDQPAGGLDNAFYEASAYALAAWITESRRTAYREGVHPVPPSIRKQLEGFVPVEILDTVRWRVGGTSQLALQTHLPRLGLVAVTLADVVVFAEAETALHDAGLWAHELRHVMQYHACGIAAFARTYIREHDRLEDDAREYANRWHQWTLDQRRKPLN
jgi:hypothetical protein